MSGQLMSFARDHEPPAPGLTKIGRSLVRTSLPFILGTCVPASMLLAWPTMGLVGPTPRATGRR